MRYLILAVFLLVPGTQVLAETLTVDDNLTLSYELVTGWHVHSTAPEALVDDIAEHIAHEAEAAGQQPTPEQARAAARKRLAANEAIIYHTASGSHLDIDFSPLGADEHPPTPKTLRKSAEFAVQSLSTEGDIADVEAGISEVEVVGTQQAFRIDATYRQHDEPVRFIGVIGFVDGYWFFFYFTAPGADPAVVAGMEQILGSLRISANR